MAARDTLLFLGSGATVGSGLRKSGALFPADDFFESSVVKQLLKRGGYPALTILRESIASLRHSSLFLTWNNLYIHRSLARSGVLEEPKAARRRVEALRRYRWPKGYEGQAAHYEAFWKRLPSVPATSENSAASELALWDLRLLIKEIYDPSSDVDTSGSVYGRLWEAFAPRVRNVINFNYDMTFDQAIHAPARRRILHPHGSLEWTSKGEWKARGPGKGYWSRWQNHRGVRPPLSSMGLRARGRNTWRFQQPLIVPPPVFKEEVIGSSSRPGLRDLLRMEWERMAQALQRSGHWVFIGFSFASGDEHLVYLLKRLYDGQTICCSFYNPYEMPANRALFEKLMEVSRYRLTLCIHPISPGETIAAFLDKRDCIARKR